jgi:hypothetical protein
LTTIATELELQKANNKGKVPYGALARLVHEYKESFPWLSKDMIQNHIRKLSKQTESTVSLLEDTGTDNGVISSFLKHSNSTMTSSLTNTSSAYDNYNNVLAQTTSDGAENSTNHSNNFYPSDVMAKTNSSIGAENSTKVHASRPKGLTMESSRDFKHHIELATEEAAEIKK